MTEERKNTLVQRLNIIQGQVSGLSNLLKNQKNDCQRITNQFYAILSAFKKVMEIYFKENLTECIRGRQSKESKNKLEFLLKEIFKSK